MALASGDDAPTVTAPNQDGEEVTLSFEEPTVLYFYPATRRRVVQPKPLSSSANSRATETRA